MIREVKQALTTLSEEERKQLNSRLTRQFQRRYQTSGCLKKLLERIINLVCGLGFLTRKQVLDKVCSSLRPAGFAAPLLNPATTPIENIAPDIIKQIFGYLEPKDLLAVGLVNKQWRKITEEIWPTQKPSRPWLASDTPYSVDEWLVSQRIAWNMALGTPLSINQIRVPGLADDSYRINYDLYLYQGNVWTWISSRNGNTLSLKRWDLTNGETTYSLPFDQRGGPLCFHFSAERQLLACGTGGEIQTRNLSNKSTLSYPLGQGEMVRNITFGFRPDELYVSVQRSDGTLELCSLDLVSKVLTQIRVLDVVVDWAFSPDRLTAVCIPLDAGLTCSLWSADGREICSLGSERNVSYSPDGLFLATFETRGKYVYIRDAHKGAVLRKLMIPGIESVAISVEGRFVCVGLNPATQWPPPVFRSNLMYRIFDTQDEAWTEVANFHSPYRFMKTNVCFSEDGRSLLLRSPDGWEIQNFSSS